MLVTSEILAAKFGTIFPHLDERQRRLLMGAEARALEHGGIRLVARAAGGACWMCGLPAVCGEKLPGRRHKARLLCQAHADAVFGSQDPPWRRLDARTQRDIVEEWLRGMTILAHGGGQLSAYDLTCRSAYDLTCWFAGSLAG